MGPSFGPFETRLIAPRECLKVQVNLMPKQGNEISKPCALELVFISTLRSLHFSSGDVKVAWAIALIVVYADIVHRC